MSDSSSNNNEISVSGGDTNSEETNYTASDSVISVSGGDLGTSAGKSSAGNIAAEAAKTVINATEDSDTGIFKRGMHGESTSMNQGSLEDDYDISLPNLGKGQAAEATINEWDTFNRFRVEGATKDVYEQGSGFLFISTPNLNIDDNNENGVYNINNNGFLTELYRNQPYILNALNTSSNFNKFIKMLSNRFLSFEPKDTTLRTRTIGETFYGYKLTLPGSMIDSIIGDQFTITYQEDNSLNITKLHKVWTDYIENVKYGNFRPRVSSIDEGEIDYLASAYFFALKPDGQTITYFCKYTGVAPLGVPYSAFGYRIGDSGKVELSIPYVYTFKEDLEPEILNDFNLICDGSKVKVAKRTRTESLSGQPSYEYILVFEENGFTSNS